MPLALAALVGTAAVLVLGRGLDAAAYDTVQLLRTCRLDTLVAPLVHAWDITFACGLGTFAWLLRQRRGQAAIRMGVVTLGGALVCEWLKLFFDRPRPSALPGLLHGHSFPSGHVFNTTVVWATILSALARAGARAWVRWTAGTAAALTIAAVSTHRVYVGQHWVSDILATGCLAAAWLRWAPHIQSNLIVPLRPARLAAALALPVLFTHISGLRVPLPAANRSPLNPALMVDLGKPAARPFLRGTWSQDMREPAGTLNWILGDQAGLSLPLSPGSYRLRFVARPFEPPQGKTCTYIDLRLNGRRIRRQLMYTGWREYRVQVPAALIGPDRSLLTIRVRRSPHRNPPSAAGRSAAFLFVAAEEAAGARPRRAASPHPGSAM